jgi:HEAT repeat protein
MGLLSWLTGKKEAQAQAAPQQEAEAPEETAPGVPLEQLGAWLESRNGGQRVDAVQALVERWRGGDGAAAELVAPRLAALLDDAEPQVRLAALTGARLLQKPENLQKVASGVLALLADASSQVRSRAVWAAARLPGEVARTQVRALLRSSEDLLRFAAACALAEQHDAACLPVLVSALEQDVYRQEALTALLALGDPGAVEPVAALFDSGHLGDFDQTEAAAVLARFGDGRGIRHLVARIEESGDDRPIAVEWVGRLRVKEAAEAVARVAEEEGDPARGAALRALGQLGAPGAFDRLARLAEGDADPDLRLDAAEGLAELGSPEARALLERLGAGPGKSELGRLARQLLAELAAADAQEAAAAQAKAAETAGAGTTQAG